MMLPFLSIDIAICYTDFSLCILQWGQEVITKELVGCYIFVTVLLRVFIVYNSVALCLPIITPTEFSRIYSLENVYKVISSFTKSNGFVDLKKKTIYI